MTEASAVAALYSGFLAFVVNKGAKLSDLPSIFKSAASSTGLVMILSGAGGTMAWIVANQRLLDGLIGTLSSMPVWVFLLCVNVLLLGSGCLLDDYASTVIWGPLVAPLAWQLGVHPLHIGAIFCINLVIGLATPPFGLTLFITSPIAGVPLEDTVKNALPLIAVSIGVLLLLTFVPEVCLFVPRLLGYV